MPANARHRHDPRQFRPVLYICAARANLILSCVYWFYRYCSTLVVLRYCTVQLRKPFLFRMRWGPFRGRSHTCHAHALLAYRGHSRRGSSNEGLSIIDYQVATSLFDPHMRTTVLCFTSLKAPNGSLLGHGMFSSFDFEALSGAYTGSVYQGLHMNMAATSAWPPLSTSPCLPLPPP